jgi:Zn-dependent protease with chaperone function
MKRRIINNLSSKEYEHDFDRKALISLEKTPGLGVLVRKFNKYWSDKIWKIQVTGSYIKVNERNFPEVDSALKEACSILNVKNIPDLYLKWDYSVNAFTAGVESPLIVLNSGCIDLLSYDELLYIIGHELGHIKSQHVLYHQMANVLPILGDIIGSATLGIGNLVSTAIEAALLNWKRMSEFTADRAGLLACQDIEAATTATIKLAGLPNKYSNSANIDEFIKQAREFEDFDYDTLDRAVKFMSTMYNSHPWTVMRASQLFKWVDSGEYNRILDRKYIESNTASSSSNNHEKVIITCSNCKAKLRVPKYSGSIIVKCPKCNSSFEISA